MKNLKKTAQRIKRAIKNKEKIVIFADADLDGVVSAVLLKESVDFLGGDLRVFISDREKWGYGLSKKAVSVIKKEAPAVLISLDCGISNFQGAQLAKELGFFLIIIDHHKVIEELPEADIILDPHQKTDKTTFKKLANAGIVYYLTQELLKDNFPKKERLFLELTALATVADMVPREEDNKKILDKGIKYLASPFNIGLKEAQKEITDDFVEGLVSMLNITPPEKKVNKAYLLLTTEDKKIAKEIVKHLKKEVADKKKRTKKEEQKLLKKIEADDHFVLWGGDFEKMLGGKLTSRVMQRFKKSTFLYTTEKSYGLGSVRTIKGDDAIEIMSYCKKHLHSYGGHPEAAGFQVKLKDVERFREKLKEYYSRKK